ncbi:MAG TPA: tetratricopeptide repeat protein, partial [Lacipirellulaceae bacterium]|nr:tetratricopeptide repeat protein [Lacipirellulaceae bacterium]
MRLQGSANPPLALYGLLTGLTILPLGCTRESAPAEAPPAGAAPASAARESEAQRHLEAARQHAAAQQHAKAVDEYTAALQAMRIQAQMGQNDSLDADVLYARGVAYLAMGFPDTAAADFSEVLRVQTDNGLAYAKRGEAYAKLGDLYKAVRDCTNAIRFAPGSADAYRYRGQAYLARAQFDRSVADLEQAASLEPALAGEIAPLLTRAYRAWGERLAEDGDVASAEEKLARARELDPSPGTTASVNATPDQEAVELTAAKQVVDQAQEQFEQGVSLLRQQRFDEALAALTAAIEVRPDFAEAYLRRGEALMRLDFPDTAVKDLEQAIHHSGGLTEA